MSPNEIPIPLEKTVVINGSTIEVSIAEKKMSDKEKTSYKKFMAKCISESSGKTDREAAMSCAVTFERMKEKIMAEDEEDELEEIKEEEDEEEDEEEKEEEGKTLEEKIKLEKQDIKEDEEYLKELEKKKMEQSKSAAKKGAKMEYREKPKTPANSVGIITVEQINKWEKHEKNENRIDELRETKEAWKNTVDL